MKNSGGFREQFIKHIEYCVPLLKAVEPVENKEPASDVVMPFIDHYLFFCGP